MVWNDLLLPFIYSGPYTAELEWGGHRCRSQVRILGGALHVIHKYMPK